MKRFYITTPLYYVNDKPHLGTVYSTVIADILKRYHQLFKYETFLLTGTDEHGQKCLQSAQKQNIPIQDYCNKMAQQFENTWKLLNISHNRFLRTTAGFHKQAVQRSLSDLYRRGLIYSADYEGWYCVSDESFYTAKDLQGGLSPTGKEVSKIQEKNYFFKMSAYQARLREHIIKNPNFIQPSAKRNEVLGFLKNPLEDLCISRPKSRVSWGVELPFDQEFVTYVWVDALLNYLTGIGWTGPNSAGASKSDWEKWWNEAGAVHIIGKDILITHAVYWPCLLMALGCRLPKTIFAHGWLLNSSQEKMSKSKGDVMDPKALLKFLDSDSLRYFLAGGLSLGNDAPISLPLIGHRLNEDLANNLGNLHRRITTMLVRHFNSMAPSAVKAPGELERELKAKGAETVQAVKEHVLHLRLQKACAAVLQVLNESNKYLEMKAPWRLVKEDKNKTADVLRSVLEMLYLCAVLLKPVMPDKMSLLLDSLGGDLEGSPDECFKDGAGWQPSAKQVIKDIPPLFPRLDQKLFNS